jgi:hypothetical protein
MEKLKGTDSATATFLKSKSEGLNKTTKRPPLKPINPKIDDISKNPT